MAEIVITEKASQAKDVRAAVGTRYGKLLPAEGHLFDLLEPEDVVPAWKRWATTTAMVLMKIGSQVLAVMKECDAVPSAERKAHARRRFDEIDGGLR